MKNEIPKIIHYCWFGGNPLSEMALKCIDSWRKFFPDYEIIQWNETNFDVHACKYIEEAYAEKKWAHVSDYARIKVLYEHGGIYFDTDVEVIKDFTPILNNGNFCGFEREGNNVALGLGFGAKQHSSFLLKLLEDYESSSFYTKDGKPDYYNTIVKRVNSIFIKNGLVQKDEVQYICDFYIYPKRYFCPMNYESGEVVVTDDTYSIHWYEGTWMPKSDLKIHQKEQYFRSKFPHIGNQLGYIYRKGYRLCELLLGKRRVK